MNKRFSILAAIFLSATLYCNAQQAKKTDTTKTDKKVSKVLVLTEDCQDPICKMHVKKGSKLVSVYQGKPFGFCSKYCKEQFDKNPEKYAK